MEDVQGLYLKKKCKTRFSDFHGSYSQINLHIYCNLSDCLLVEIDKRILKCTEKYEEPAIAKMILGNKVGGFH